MTGSLKTRLLLRLSLAQAGAIAVMMGLFPLVVPYISYSDIADTTARKLIERALDRSPAGTLRLRPDAALTHYLAERPGFTFAIVDARTGQAADGSAEALTGVVRSFGRYLPLPGGNIVTRLDGARTVLIEMRETPPGLVAFATSGNVFRLSDLPSFVDVFLPVIGPMLAPLLFGALVVIPLVVGRAMRPLLRAAQEASGIDLATLDRRLSSDGMPRELVPLVRSINAALDRLDDGVKRQQRYNANAAHEMRTPVAVLQARIDALPESVHRQALRRDVHRIATLVEQLLTVARLGQHAVAMDEMVDLAACARSVIADRAPLAIRDRRQIALAVEGTHPVIRGNGRAIASALANLIDNAVRAEPEGGTVEVTVGGQTRKVWVEIADHGDGIAPEDRAQVFEPFWRKDERPPGTGLGLAIVREVVTLHGGIVSVTDTPGGGARFRIEMPSVTEAALAA